MFDVRGGPCCGWHVKTLKILFKKLCLGCSGGVGCKTISSERCQEAGLSKTSLALHYLCDLCVVCYNLKIYEYHYHEDLFTIMMYNGTYI